MPVRLRYFLIGTVIMGSLLNGCAVSEEDRDFYYRGWIRPTDLDRAAPSKLGPRGQHSASYPRDPLID